MVRIRIKVDGMTCGMCQAHVNDAVRRAFQVQKVSSSRSKGETVILSQEELDPALLKKVLEETGYRALEIRQEPYEKRGLFRKRPSSSAPCPREPSKEKSAGPWGGAGS